MCDSAIELEAEIASQPNNLRLEESGDTFVVCQHQNRFHKPSKNIAVLLEGDVLGQELVCVDRHFDRRG